LHRLADGPSASHFLSVFSINGKKSIFANIEKQTMLDLRKTLALLFLLPACSFPAFSQRPDSFWGKIVDMISAPSMELDPSAVYQPAARWNVAVSGELNQAGITQENKIDFSYLFDEEDGGRTNLHAFTSTKLLGGVDKVIGLQVGYGNLSLGWNQRIGGDGVGSNTSFSFDYLAPGYALQLQYFDFRRPVDYEMGIQLGEGWDDFEDSGQTEKPGRMTTFIADAFYAFNRRSFAYSAVYKGNVVQRRSAGTWMFGIKYLQGLVEYDPDELIISDILFGLVRQDTRQASFGGGFSYNLVPFHRQPGADGKGLRNLTINLTAIPMVTLFNQFSSSMMNIYLEEDPVLTKNVINGKLHVNYVFKAGAIYSWDRFFIGVSGSYDSYNYRGSTDIPQVYSDSDVDFDKIHSSGRFSRWSASLKLCVKL
jgi:hypothetical protein